MKKTNGTWKQTNAQTINGMVLCSYLASSFFVSENTHPKAIKYFIFFVKSIPIISIVYSYIHYKCYFFKYFFLVSGRRGQHKIGTKICVTDFVSLFYQFSSHFIIFIVEKCIHYFVQLIPFNSHMNSRIKLVRVSKIYWFYANDVS